MAQAPERDLPDRVPEAVRVGQGGQGRQERARAQASEQTGARALEDDVAPGPSAAQRLRAPRGRPSSGLPAAGTADELARAPTSARAACHLVLVLDVVETPLTAKPGVNVTRTTRCAETKIFLKR